MQFTEYSTLLVTHEDDLVLITINRPGALNALSSEVIDELDHVFHLLESAIGPDHWPFRGVLLTGAGAKAFVAGADIREMKNMSPSQAWEYSSRMQAITLLIERLPVPVIAAVNGFALGGGCELAMACDFIYASASASFGQPEVSLGLVPGFGGSVRLQRRVGPALAREMLFTGRIIAAPEALRIGLVNSVFENQEQLLEESRKTLGAIARQSPVAVAAVKATAARVEHAPIAEGLALEAESFRHSFTTADMQEGTRAFLAKEKPVFPGR